ncbi:MAG: hypothetical protein WBA38_04195 [Gordonia sp. (in: high G+C Gram-positive bacteria)]|uniref:hypothetical protein n=1 Tax=Gordonia sp. (in: high G+C Gram-positive bacteria) TaxID=84139 RepID=UPI003C7206D9
MSTPHILTIPCRKPAMTSNEQRRWHWSKQSEAIKTMHWQVRAALSARPVARQSEPIAIRVTQYPPTRTARDHDSLNPFMKAAQDALVKAGIIADDTSAIVRRGTTEIGPVDRENPRIEIAIIPATYCFVCDQTAPPPPACGPNCHITDADQELADRYAQEDHR